LSEVEFLVFFSPFFFIIDLVSLISFGVFFKDGNLVEVDMYGWMDRWIERWMGWKDG